MATVSAPGSEIAPRLSVKGAPSSTDDAPEMAIVGAALVTVNTVFPMLAGATPSLTRTATVHELEPSSTPTAFRVAQVTDGATPAASLKSPSPLRSQP